VRVVTLSLVPSMSAEAASGSLESELLDVRLHAPTHDIVIVWVAGPVGSASAPLLTLRVRQQFERAAHVILDLSSVTWLDPHVAAGLRALGTHAEGCGTRLHIAGAENPAITEPLRHLDSAHVAAGPADAVLAVLTTRAGGPALIEEVQ
jgi:MFS superfamily sulfate permease-like transporter